MRKAMRKQSKRVITAADLFAGAGGTSSGLHAACTEIGAQLKLVAVNHWDVAINTHAHNHPYAEHYCQNLDSVDPRKVVAGGKLDLLVASPECIHFSNARGGKPINDQSRASAWHILRWCEALYVENLLIENVKEFQNWGGLSKSGRPLKNRRGETFIAFLKALESLGYTVDYRVLNAADFGDPTSRERLFIQARRGRKPIIWPEPTHVPQVVPSLFEQNKQKWRTAREIIDWSIPSESIFNRKKPLAEKTLARIFAGLQKYCGLPFIVPNFGERTGQQPRTHSIDNPLPAVTGHGAGALVQPFIVELRNNLDARSIDEPISTVTAGGSHHALCEPFVIPQQSGGSPRSVDRPLPTIATAGAISLVQPFLIGTGGPQGSAVPRSIEQPLGTVLTQNHTALIQPYLIKYNSTGGPLSLDEPLDTISTRDRFGLVVPQLGAVLDIRFRMLQPHELAAAMSFPKDYKFTGTREQQVRQIGNAVPVNTAKALCLALLQSAA